MSDGNGALQSARRFYGKYKGVVINNVDPMQKGRLLVSVPDVLGAVPSNWAEPCVPLAGPTGTQLGAYLVPPIGAGVWVEFEQGDPQYPIWTGCRWGSAADIPVLALAGLPVSPNIVIQSAAQNTFMISDVPGPTGGIMLKSTTGAAIIVNDVGIFISNGKGASIVMAGPTVTVNQGALVVT
jgi:uncharacterized protein involved in type VI secretion and phage assembly